MPKVVKLIPVELSDERSLKTLVENRKVFTLNYCELNVFETFQASYLVPLTFGDFVVTSMLRGKKVMHLFDKPGFDYLPGETVMVPANITMKIDFPEATKNNPTQCIALALDNGKIKNIVNRLNEDYPKTGNDKVWQLQYNNYHFQNDSELAQIINRIIRICSGASLGKDVLADLSLTELVVRIIQTQSLNSIEKEEFSNCISNPLSFIINYIKSNINNKIQIDELSRQACMSQPTFYRSFKREFGITPLDYILKEKIKLAKQMLSDYKITITEICYQLGFTSLNYFDRQFKRLEGITPKQYRQIISKQ